MNQDQVTGLLRSLVPALVAYAVGKGWVPAASAADVGAALVALGMAGWSIYVNTKSQQIASVAAMPDVKKVITTPEVANTGTLAANDKVVSK